MHIKSLNDQLSNVQSYIKHAFQDNAEFKAFQQIFTAQGTYFYPGMTTSGDKSISMKCGVSSACL